MQVSRHRLAESERVMLKVMTVQQVVSFRVAKLPYATQF